MRTSLSSTGGLIRCHHPSIWTMRPDRAIASVISGRSSDWVSGFEEKKTGQSLGNKPQATSSPGLTEFVKKFVDSEILTTKLQDWFSEVSENSTSKKPAFEFPFELSELQKFDYALEGAAFQQLIRMPNAVYPSTSDSVEATAFLAIEDFLHAGLKGLWEMFWGQDGPMPFTVASLHNSSMRFYPAEKAIAGGKIGGLCATAVLLKNNRHLHGRWDQILELVLLRPDVGSLSMENDREPSLSVLGEALFFAVRILLSRSLSKFNVLHNSNCVYVLLIDSKYGRVVKLEGDATKLDPNMDRVYESAAEWIMKYSKVTVSPIDRIWNKLGNANWRDIGALQVLLATFHSIIQFLGMPKKLVSDLALDHSSLLQKRRSERQLVEALVNGNGSFRLQQCSFSPEIVEVHDESVKIVQETRIKLEVGSVLWLDDSNWKQGFQVNEVLANCEASIYCVTSLEAPGKILLLYVGSHPSQLDPALEDMNLWYQVQRQTRILSGMKLKGLSSKYLPQLVASGRIIHPGQCRKLSSGGHCDHPWCGTPILVTSPVGETVADMVRDGRFGPDEALRCCHDCLSALCATASAGIRHSDICPDNVIHVTSGVTSPYYVLIGWGHAVLEDKDRPAMNLLYSSTFALLEGKLCSASDAESLIYLLYFSSGGISLDLGSVEAALQWREHVWSRRLIQQKLGDISAVLKAFADYIDSLCGTPYAVDYKIWLRRLSKSIYDEEHGKEVETSGSVCVTSFDGRGESSGTSGL